VNILDEALAFKKGKLKLDGLKEGRQKAIRQLAEMVDEGYERPGAGTLRYKKHSSVQRGQYVYKMKVK
jgi:hypothetical protein